MRREERGRGLMLEAPSVESSAMLAEKDLVTMADQRKGEEPM